MAIVRQIEEMEYKQQAAKAGAWSTGLEVRVGHGSGKVGEKRFATHAILGGARRQKRGRVVRETRSSKTRVRKRPNTSRKGFKARGRGKLWSKESVLCPREPARQGRCSVGREWPGRGQEDV
jgi:hypothetical protein